MREEEIIERAKDLYPKLLPLSTYICGYAYHDNDGTPKEIIQKYLAIGAEWAREQMMKEAVDGEISSVDVGDDSYVKKLKVPGLREAIRKFNVGDKVRIIILPKEDGE